MTYPGKNPHELGAVPFGFSMDGSWTAFDDFYFYRQIELTEVTPLYGPAVGNGLIYLYGKNFRDEFARAELGCKIGSAVGRGELIAGNTIRCFVEEMELVPEGYGLPIKLALNSYSWVGVGTDSTPAESDY